jgi:hypothetical protein
MVLGIETVYPNVKLNISKFLTHWVDLTVVVFTHPLSPKHSSVIFERGSCYTRLELEISNTQLSQPQLQLQTLSTCKSTCLPTAGAPADLLVL